MPRRTDISSIVIIGAGPQTPSPHRGRGWRASARRVRGRGQGLLDRRPDAIQILQHIIVPETKDSKTLTFQERCSACVSLRRVLPAVDLDDQAHFGAEEVGDVAVDLNLLAELESIQLAVAEDAPELSFGIGGVAAQPSRSGRQKMVPCHIAPSPQPSPARGEGVKAVSLHA